MSPEFLCVLQTHTLSNNQSGYVRYGCNDKAEITKRCVRSLVKSLNYAAQSEQGKEFTFKLQVFDDHSDGASVQILKETLKTAGFETNLTHLDTYGIMPSIEACYRYGKDHGKDLVYFAQDDYLYTETAIWEMIDQFYLVSNRVGKWCAIYPYDDPYKYQPWNIVQTRIVYGARRHWRQIYGAASCIMTHHQVITENWDLFEAMAKHKVTSDMEDNTINKLFSEREYVMMSPIPSLALHFQFDSEKDPYINWESWWELHKD